MSGTSGLLLLLLCQTPPPFSAGVQVEPRIERLRYRFENPSRYDTAELVPHSFEQTYDTDNVWVGVHASHPFFGGRGRIEAALTPSATRRADDFDTFHQPDGNIVVSGTTGNASLRSWRISEHMYLVRRGSVAMALGFSYRHDGARFHEGDGVTTTTRPPSVTHRLVITREETSSDWFAPSWKMELARTIRRKGLLSIGADLAPLARGRLTVVLPDKYPGQRLKFDARVASAAVDARCGWTAGRWMVSARVSGGRTFSWRQAAQMELGWLALGVDVERR